MASKLFNKKVLFVDDVGNQEKLARRNQQGEQEIEDAARTSGVPVESVSNTKPQIKAIRAPLEELLVAGFRNEEGLPNLLERLGASAESKANVAKAVREYVTVLDGIVNNIRLNQSPSADQIRVLKERMDFLNRNFSAVRQNLIAEGISSSDLRVKELDNLIDYFNTAEGGTPHGILNDLNALHSVTEQLSSSVEPSSAHASSAPPAAKQTVVGGPLEEGVGAKPKPGILDSAKGGLVAGAVVATIGALMTYGGTGLAAGSCGNFQATVKDMETKLYNQYLQVKIAILQVQAAQAAASK